MMNGVKIERVDDLYQSYERFGRAMAPDGTHYNPLSGRVSVIPADAKYYAMVHADDESDITMAKRLIAGISSRRRVHTIMVEKSDVNFNQFSKPGKVAVVYA